MCLSFFSRSGRERNCKRSKTFDREGSESRLVANPGRGVGKRGEKCLRRVLFAEEAEDREVKEFRLHGEPEKVNSLPLVN